MTAELTNQDWNFQVFGCCDDNGAELVGAGWFEHARESRNIRTTIEKWFRLEKARAELTQRAKDQGIEKKDLESAFLICWQGIRFEQWVKHRLEQEPGYEPNLAQSHRDILERDYPAAVRLLSGLSPDNYRDVVCNDYEVQKIESFGDIKAPRLSLRLRFLAEHLIEDRPWLLIPRKDRDNAIANTFKSAYLRLVPPVEIEDELQDLVRQGKALPGFAPGDVVIPSLRSHYGSFTEKEILDAIARLVKDRRPSAYQHKATDRGHHRLTSWWRALQDLAAMRLAHALPPRKAIEEFRKLYGPNIDERDFRRRRRRSISTFQDLFHTDEEPRHQETFSQRRHRRGD